MVKGKGKGWHGDRKGHRDARVKGLSRGLASDIALYRNRYSKATNMGCSEMKRWRDNPLSRRASVGRLAVNRNVRLQCGELSSPRDLVDLKKATSYLSRAKSIPRSKTEVGDSGYTKNEIALKNWAFDVKKVN